MTGQPTSKLWRGLRLLSWSFAAAGCLWVHAAMALANEPAPSEPGLLCRQAIRQAEAGSGLPEHMLGAIARVESGRPDRVTGRLHPWPWTINAEGRGYFFDSKAEAVEFAHGLQARGVRSFDTGCLQVNVMYHPDAFSSLDEAFDPLANARYAVKFLTELRDKGGSWEKASAWYHSANPEQGDPYRAKVVAAIAAESASAGTYATLPAAATATARPPVVSAMRSLPAGPGQVLMRSASSMGTILPLPGAGFLGGASATGAPLPGSILAAGFGRGLDAYRRTPVAMVGPRLMASR
jgi:hypothetical protein